jgi:hypothetical protein
MAPEQCIVLCNRACPKSQIIGSRSTTFKSQKPIKWRPVRKVLRLNIVLAPKITKGVDIELISMISLLNYLSLRFSSVWCSNPLLPKEILNLSGHMPIYNQNGYFSALDRCRYMIESVSFAVFQSYFNHTSLVGTV